MLVDFDLIIKATKEDKLGWESQKGYNRWMSDELKLHRRLYFYNNGGIFYCDTSGSHLDPEQLVEFIESMSSGNRKILELKQVIECSVKRRKQQELEKEKNKLNIEIDELKERGFASNDYWHYERKKGDKYTNDRE